MCTSFFETSACIHLEASDQSHLILPQMVSLGDVGWGGWEVQGHGTYGCASSVVAQPPAVLGDGSQELELWTQH